MDFPTPLSTSICEFNIFDIHAWGLKTVLLSGGTTRIGNYRKCLPPRGRTTAANSEKSFCKKGTLTEAVNLLLSCDLLNSVFVLFISKNPS